VSNHQIMELKQELGFDIPRVDHDEECKDDDCWVAHRWWAPYHERKDVFPVKHIMIGDHDEFDSQGINGFSNYVPKGERKAMLEHLAANFEARKAYFAQSAIFAGEEFPDPRGVRPMKSFIESALHALDQAQAMMGESISWGACFDAVVALRTTLLDYQQTLTENEETVIRAWAKHAELSDSDSEDGSEDGMEEDDDDDADDGDSDSVFSFDSSYLP
jgi:hypothetical protein